MEQHYPRFIRGYFIISIAALFFFSTSFGLIFYKNITDPNRPHTDNGLGMAYAIFVPPVGLTLLLFFCCIYSLYLSKATLNLIGFTALTILAVPVGIFAIFMVMASVVCLGHLL